MNRFGRRRLLAGMATGALWAAGRRGEAAPPPRSLLVRLERPPGLETPVAALDNAYTPNALFFVRSHFDPPARGLFEPRLAIGGKVAKPLSFTARELNKLEVVELPAVLQCSGNGRALHPAHVPGVQWEKGAVGCARWRGVRLSALLEKAGLAKEVAHIHLRGVDTPPHPGTPAFLRSLPLERAMDPHTLVAFAMNDELLPHLHGGPLRLVVPGWAGNHWMKWLCEITAAVEPAKGFFMETAYQMPVKAGSDQYAPLGALPVKSVLTRPLDGAVVGKGAHVEVRGQAFTGTGDVTKVEVSVDGGKTWADAKVDKLLSPGAWQRFRYDWKPADAGPVTVLSRATDSAGNVQPEVSPPNRSGYFWNGWDRVKCEVKA